jgi:hypothetical protein
MSLASLVPMVQLLLMLAIPCAPQSYHQYPVAHLLMVSHLRVWEVQRPGQMSQLVLVSFSVVVLGVGRVGLVVRAKEARFSSVANHDAQEQFYSQEA